MLLICVSQEELMHLGVDNNFLFWRLIKKVPPTTTTGLEDKIDCLSFDGDYAYHYENSPAICIESVGIY